MNSTQFEQFENSAIIYSNKYVPFLLSGSKLLTYGKCNFITDAQVYYYVSQIQNKASQIWKKKNPEGLFHKKRFI